MQPIPPSFPSHESDRFPLDGTLERNQFGPGLTILAGLVIGFIAFQGLSAAVLVVTLIASGRLNDLTGMDPATIVETFASEMLIANTVGQFLGLLLIGWVLARLHTSRPLAMLRVRGTDWGTVALSVVGWVALFPLVQWSGTFFDGLPWPEWLREFEQAQIDLIEQVMAADLGFFFTLFTMAITPAICEELFFRGYIQRQSERLFGGWIAAVVFTGVVFGLYHLRITQAVPLSMLGIYMAYVVWRSNSLVPGVLVHLANNGFAVALGAYVASSETLSLEDVETMDIPVYIVVLSAIVFVGVVRMLHRRGGTASRPHDGQTAED